MSTLSSGAGSDTEPSSILFVKTLPLSSDIEVAAKGEHVDMSFEHKTMYVAFALHPVRYV